LSSSCEALKEKASLVQNAKKNSERAITDDLPRFLFPTGKEQLFRGWESALKAKKNKNSKKCFSKLEFWVSARELFQIDEFCDDFISVTIL